jgi:hypothetical protein
VQTWGPANSTWWPDNPFARRPAAGLGAANWAGGAAGRAWKRRSPGATLLLALSAAEGRHHAGWHGPCQGITGGRRAACMLVRVGRSGQAGRGWGSCCMRIFGLFTSAPLHLGPPKHVPRCPSRTPRAAVAASQTGAQVKWSRRARRTALRLAGQGRRDRRRTTAQDASEESPGGAWRRRAADVAHPRHRPATGGATGMGNWRSHDPMSPWRGVAPRSPPGPPSPLAQIPRVVGRYVNPVLTLKPSNH